MENMLSMAHSIHRARGGGYLHKKTYGNVPLYLMFLLLFLFLFHKKSLNMGPVFYKKKKRKISKHGSLFPIASTTGFIELRFVVQTACKRQRGSCFWLATNVPCVAWKSFSRDIHLQWTYIMYPKILKHGLPALRL